MTGLPGKVEKKILSLDQVRDGVWIPHIGDVQKDLMADPFKID